MSDGRPLDRWHEHTRHEITEALADNGAAVPMMAKTAPWVDDRMELVALLCDDWPHYVDLARSAGIAVTGEADQRLLEARGDRRTVIPVDGDPHDIFAVTSFVPVRLPEPGRVLPPIGATHWGSDLNARWDKIAAGHTIEVVDDPIRFYAPPREPGEWHRRLRHETALARSLTTARPAVPELPPARAYNQRGELVR